MHHLGGYLVFAETPCSLESGVVSEQMLVASGEVRVEIFPGKDPRTCERVAQQITWVSGSRSRFEHFRAA